MAILDSVTIIDLMRRPKNHHRRRAWQLIRTRLLAGDRIATTRLNVAELYVGIEMAGDPKSEAAKVAFALKWLGVLDFDDQSAKVYARVFAHLRARGKNPADMDLLIASIALANGQSLITRNPKHFNSVPGLTVYAY